MTRRIKCRSQLRAIAQNSKPRGKLQALRKTKPLKKKTQAPSKRKNPKPFKKKKLQALKKNPKPPKRIKTPSPPKEKQQAPRKLRCVQVTRGRLDTTNRTPPSCCSMCVPMHLLPHTLCWFPPHPPRPKDSNRKMKEEEASLNYCLH